MASALPDRLPARGVHAVLLECAARRDDPALLAAAGVLAQAASRPGGTETLPIPGLDATQTRALMERWFPGALARLGVRWTELAAPSNPAARFDEVDDLVALFGDHASHTAGPSDEACWIAHVLACGSLGDNHLWQDLLLPSRRELSALIGHWFPGLATRNSRDMKWKKFFYKQLCERAELFVCRAPSCAVCTDYALCFGPE